MNATAKELLLSNELLANVYYNQNLEVLSNEELLGTLKALQDSLSDSKPYTMGRHAHGVLCQIIPMIEPKIKDVDNIEEYINSLGVMYKLENRILKYGYITDLSHGIENNYKIYFIATTKQSYISGPYILN